MTHITGGSLTYIRIGIMHKYLIVIRRKNWKATEEHNVVWSDIKTIFIWTFRWIQTKQIFFE